MSHTFRFLGEIIADGTWLLADDEAHHLNKVLRLAVGTEVEVTDGQGTWARGLIAASTPKEARIAASEVHRVAVPALQLELAVGALKPGAVDEILPMLCELGLDAIHVFGQHGVAKARLAPKVRERWHRIIVQSTKQCKRSWLPRLAEHESVAAFVASAAPEASSRLMLRGAGDPGLNALLPSLPSGRLLVAAGGEKGFDPAEESLLLGAGFLPASLGPYVLRAVTATIAAAASMSLHRGEL